MGTWRRGRGFRLAVVLLLALGVGATTAMFSVVNGVLLRPLALRDPGRLMLIGERVPQMPQLAGNGGLAWFDTPAAFLAWQREASDFTGVAALIYSRMPAMSGGAARLLHGAKVSSNFFDVLEVRAGLGRTFDASDPTDASNPVILTDAAWRGDFGADPAIVGRNIAPPGSSATVVGILPEGFTLQGRELGPMFAGTPTEFFRAIDLRAAAMQPGAIFSGFSYHVMGRLRAGVTPAEALAQLNGIQANLARMAPEKLSLYAQLTSVQDFAVAQARQELWLLLGGAGALLLIVCVNLGGLWISRLADRRREWGIRAALGAAPGQLARQVLGEALGLGLVGGALGVGCAAAGLRIVLASAPAGLPRLGDVHVDWRVLAFGLALAVFFGLATGLVPALRLARLDPQNVLRTMSSGATHDAESVRSRQILIALQAALSTVLLTAAGLLGLSFYRLASQPTGFAAQHAAEAEISLIEYSTGQRLAILRQLPAMARALPGVTAAGFTTQLPLTSERGMAQAEVPGKVYPEGAAPTVAAGAISPGYLEAVGVGLLAGRDLREADRKQNAMVISAAAVRLLWPEEADARAAVGREMTFGNQRWTVVGVAADARATLTAPMPATVYVPYWTGVPYSGSLVVRGWVSAAALAGPLRAGLARLAPAAPMSKLEPLQALAAASLAPQRYQLGLLLLFAALALSLAALGVYALVAHSVAQRRRELAIRMTLGASPTEIWGTVMRQALGPVGAGLGAGLAAAAIAAPWLGSLLFRVKPTNLAVLAAVAATVAIAAAAACMAPARRATQTDPLLALRAE